MCITRTSHECIICFGKVSRFGGFGGFGFGFGFGQAGAKSKCCNYWYHHHCLRNWYQSHNLCPTCRSIKQKVYRSGSVTMELHDTMFIWTDSVRRVVVPFKDISKIELLERDGKLAIEVHLNQYWASFKFWISSNNRAPDIKKMYDSIIHLKDTLSRTAPTQ